MTENPVAAEPAEDLRSDLIGIDALLMNALVVADGELALRLCGARELVYNALATVEGLRTRCAQLEQEAEALRRALKKLTGVAGSVSVKNTPEFMDYLAEQIRHAERALGERGPAGSAEKDPAP